MIDGNIPIYLYEKKIPGVEIVVVNVRDGGQALGLKVLSKLFTKFGSGSYYDVSLGLFCAKRS